MHHKNIFQKVRVTSNKMVYKKKTFSGPVLHIECTIHALLHGVICFVAGFSSRNHQVSTLVGLEANTFDKSDHTVRKGLKNWTQSAFSCAPFCPRSLGPWIWTCYFRNAIVGPFMNNVHTRGKGRGSDLLSKVYKKEHRGEGVNKCALPVNVVHALPLK